jgi:hypothetical protein
MKSRSRSETVKGAIRTEGDVRRWLKANRKHDVLWIEPAKGSTVGLPDACLLGVNGQVLWIECKAGHRTRNGLRYVLRPTQKASLRKILRRGGRAMLLVGEVGTKTLWLITLGLAGGKLVGERLENFETSLTAENWRRTRGKVYYSEGVELLLEV